MSVCRGCGGVLGRDCWNEHDCMMIAQSQQQLRPEEIEQLNAEVHRLTDECRSLAEQLSTARGEIAHWKANHDEQMRRKQVAQELVSAAESRLRDLLDADVTRARDISRLTIERDQAEQEIDRLNAVERDLREKVGKLLDWAQNQKPPIWNDLFEELTMAEVESEGQHG